jgi:hypothetical protein
MPGWFGGAILAVSTGAVYDCGAGTAGGMNEPNQELTSLPGHKYRRSVLLVIVILLFSGSVLLYMSSVGFGFIGYDESAVLLGHPNLYGQASFMASLREILVGYFPREEPLIVRDLTWLLDATLFGFTNPAGYHLGNVLLNAANVVLLFLFLLRATRSLSFAGLTAGLYATLAIHVEPVCWVMGRKDLLGAFFTFLALLVHSAAFYQTRRWRRLALHGLVFLLVPLAILSKFSAIVLVLLLAAHRLFAPFMDGTCSPREGLRMRWRELVIYVPHLAVTAGLYLWYQHILAAYQVIGDRGPSPLSFQHLNTMALLVPLSLGRTLGHMVSASEHSIAYLRPNVGLPLTGGEIAIILATLVGSVVGIIAVLRYRKDLAFFVFAFFLFMVPYFNIEYIGIWVADRYAYLSSFCVTALLVAGAVAAWRSQRLWKVRLAVLPFFLLSLMVIDGIWVGRIHQQAFRDVHAFWTYEIERSQPSMLSFESYAKTFLNDAASAETGSQQRLQAIEKAQRVAERGISYFQAQPWKSATGYFSRDLAHAAGLYTALGLASTLASDSLEQRLAYHRKAYQMMPNQNTALMIAQVLLDMARREPKSVSLAGESLHYFGQYLRHANSDPQRRTGLRGLLRQYTDDFPSLLDEVNRIAGEVSR